MSGSLRPQDDLTAIGRFIGDLDRRLRTLETLAPAAAGGGGGLVNSASFYCTDANIASGDHYPNWALSIDYGTGQPTLNADPWVIDINTSGLYLISWHHAVDGAPVDMHMTFMHTNNFNLGFGSTAETGDRWGDGPVDARSFSMFLRAGNQVSWLVNSGSTHAIESVYCALRCLAVVDDSFFGSSYAQL